ncbi:Tfp pilus assembly protein PilV [Salinibacterium sp. CAN_S4]|uniref:type IV pilus modification PilV family protein n=1 Tax=Salinibacterium sp. CAN_S4 TaxID=2787727 RepID=UPI0018F00ABF
MKALRSRLAAAQRGDAGLGMIEVIVALAIFMVVAIGIAYSAISTLRIAADSESRVIATNLAASEIDNARAAGDPLDLFSNTRTVTVNGMVYTIARTAGWVSSTGTSSGCGTGTGALQYKQVDVKVSWPTQISATQAVRANTLVAPVSRLNDPSFGTILVSVLAAAGTGASGVPISVAFSGGGAAVAMDPTDSDGCSYAFKVTPGTYVVSINKSGYISSDQKSSPSVSLEVKAGDTLSAQFSYDLAARFNLNYASNFPLVSNELRPNNLDTTFISTYGSFVNSTGTPSMLSLHPFSSGYTTIAGKYVTPIAATPSSAAVAGCLSPDPSSWPAGTVNGVNLAAGEQSPAVAAGPGLTANMNIPMGVFSLRYTGADDRYFVAESIAPSAGSGDPGCDVPMRYVFSEKLDDNKDYNLALPYGTWKLSTSNNSSGTGSLAGVVDSIVGALLGGPPPTATSFTLDPRVPQ